MLRLKILISAAPLIAAAILARVEFSPGIRPCLAIGSNTVQIASVPWHADLHVSFTDDPSLATVLVAISPYAPGSAPVIYLSHDDGVSDYRIFVRSKRFTERDAAALVVGARGE